MVTGWARCTALQLPYVPDAGAVPVLVPAARQRASTACVRVMPTARPPQFWHSQGQGVRVAAPARCIVDAARALTRLADMRALLFGVGAVAGHAELLAEVTAGSRGHRALVARALRDLADGARSCTEAELADLARTPRHLARPRPLAAAHHPRRLRAIGAGHLPVLAAAARMHARRPGPADVQLLPRGPLLPRTFRRRWPAQPERPAGP